MVAHTEFWGAPVGRRNDRRRHVESPIFSLCGIELPKGLMMPDGGQACADIRWYCKDAKACTERWTARLPRHAHIATTPASLAPALAPMPASNPVPAEVLGAPEEAWSIDPS